MIKRGRNIYYLVIINNHNKSVGIDYVFFLILIYILHNWMYQTESVRLIDLYYEILYLLKNCTNFQLNCTSMFIPSNALMHRII
jgi:hypothetical protein